MRCRICGGEIQDCGDYWYNLAERYEQHFDKDTCIEVLKNTLTWSEKTIKMLEETIENLISALEKIDDQPVNIITDYSISIASEALENL